MAFTEQPRGGAEWLSSVVGASQSLAAPPGKVYAGRSPIALVAVTHSARAMRLAIRPRPDPTRSDAVRHDLSGPIRPPTSDGDGDAVDDGTGDGQNLIC